MKDSVKARMWDEYSMFLGTHFPTGPMEPRRKTQKPDTTLSIVVGVSDGVAVCRNKNGDVVVVEE